VVPAGFNTQPQVVVPAERDENLAARVHGDVGVVVIEVGALVHHNLPASPCPHSVEPLEAHGGGGVSSFVHPCDGEVAGRVGTDAGAELIVGGRCVDQERRPQRRTGGAEPARVYAGARAIGPLGALPGHDEVAGGVEGDVGIGRAGGVAVVVDEELVALWIAPRV